MTNNNYTLEEIRKYGASKLAKGVGYCGIFSGGINLIFDAVQNSYDFKTALNGLVVIAGVALAAGLEDKITNRDKIAKEITEKTGY